MYYRVYNIYESKITQKQYKGQRGEMEVCNCVNFGTVHTKWQYLEIDLSLKMHAVNSKSITEVTAKLHLSQK